MAMAAAALLPRPKVPPVVPYLLVTFGVFIAYAAVRNVSPVDQLRIAVSGRQGTDNPRKLNRNAGTPIAGVPNPDAFVPAPDAPDTPAAAGFKAPAGGGGGGTVGPDFVPPLVPIGQGGHKLRTEAAQAFARWERAFGEQIIVTDSYRSYAAQAGAYASDSDRFGSPGTSRHVRGEAVDVNLSAIRANPSGNATERARWAKLYATAITSGWVNPRGPYAGDHKEPWHFQTATRWS